MESNGGRAEKLTTVAFNLFEKHGQNFIATASPAVRYKSSPVAGYLNCELGIRLRAFRCHQV